MTSKQPWYFGKLDDDEVTKRLQGTKTGTFLVKDSKSRGSYVLWVNEYGTPNDYPITRKSGRYTIVEREFVDVESMIDYYKKNQLDTTMLTDIASREGLPSPKTPTSPTSPGSNSTFKY